MTTLDALVAVFLSDAGVRWQAYEHAIGVAWRETVPEENTDVSDAAHRFTRSGRIQLAGFGEVDLPDGAVGADAGVRRGNAGEAGLTLSGDVTQVNGIALVRFHADEDHARVLADQFAAGATITVIADDCALDDITREANTRSNVFFRIVVDGRAFFAEAFNDEDAAGARGPATTTYVFYRDKPAQRISSMACREV